LRAYNAAKDKLLWGFQTGAGANNTAGVVSLGGKEVVPLYARGSERAGSARGDDLWLLGLNGKLGPRPAGKAAGATQTTGENEAPKKTTAEARRP
jgi:hypothetical protein